MISDIHGCIEEFNLLLRRAEYDPSRDQLILLGDYVDRGPDSRAVVEQAKRLAEAEGVIVLRGGTMIRWPAMRWRERMTSGIPTGLRMGDSIPF
ncbi:metallophosphoesterase [Paenibacillus rhizoplanae]